MKLKLAVCSSINCIFKKSICLNFSENRQQNTELFFSFKKWNGFAELKKFCCTLFSKRIKRKYGTSEVEYQFRTNESEFDFESFLLIKLPISKVEFGKLLYFFPFNYRNLLNRQNQQMKCVDIVYWTLKLKRVYWNISLINFFWWMDAYYNLSLKIKKNQRVFFPKISWQKIWFDLPKNEF